MRDGGSFTRLQSSHAFRDWRRALRLASEVPAQSPKLLKLAGHVRFQMGLHADGAVRMRYYNQALRKCREAGWRQGEALVIVHRGLAWKERGEYGKALRDFEEGLAIAREKRMNALGQLKGFIRETEDLLGLRITPPVVE